MDLEIHGFHLEIHLLRLFITKKMFNIVVLFLTGLSFCAVDRLGCTTPENTAWKPTDSHCKTDDGFKKMCLCKFTLLLTYLVKASRCKPVGITWEWHNGSDGCYCKKN